MTNKPEFGKVYALTGLNSISEGKTWAESEVKEEVKAVQIQPRESDRYEGKKYQDTKYLGIVEVAKLIRADLKAAFSNLKFAVNTKKYSGGCSLAITLTEGNFNPMSNLAETYSTINQYYINDSVHLTEEGKKVFKIVNEIVKSYLYDESDTMTDYFNCRFYYDLSVGRWDKPYINKATAIN